MAEVFFSGAESRIEGAYHSSRIADAPAVLILHPHPYYGGTMNNKIVYYLYKTFALNDFNVLRINFTGLDKPISEFEKGISGINDAAAAMDWLQNKHSNTSSYWIAGFSYGAWIAMQLLMRRPEMSSFVIVAPPAGLYDFSFLSPCPVSGLVLQGGKDLIVNEKDVSILVNQINKQQDGKVEYTVFPEAGHFFESNETGMIKSVDEYIKKRILNEVRDFAKIRSDRKRRRLKT